MSGIQPYFAVYYMRDNHTFRRLPPDPDQAIAILREEVIDGQFSHGMVCSHDTGLEHVHAHGAEKWDEFEGAARDYIQRASLLLAERLRYTQCIDCKEPFSEQNIFTEADARETQISGMCEKCFDALFVERDEEGDEGEEDAPAF